MTIAVKVHVNGKYRATIKHSTPNGAAVDTVGPNQEKSIGFQHGQINIYEITETPVED